MKISDKDFDKLISVAMSQVPDDDDIELKTDDELRSEGNSAHEFSPAFEKQMKKLIRESQKKQFPTYRAKGFRSKIRIAILVAVLVCAATMFSVGAFRTSIANFFFDLEGESSNVQFGDVAESISTEFNKYLPTYSPEGFFVETVQETPKKSIYIQFSNGNNEFYDLQCNIDVSNVSVDTEDGKITKTKINNADVTISERESRITAVYTVNDIFYSIIGNIPQEEIIKIMESIPLQ